MEQARRGPARRRDGRADASGRRTRRIARRAHGGRRAPARARRRRRLRGPLSRRAPATSTCSRSTAPRRIPTRARAISRTACAGRPRSSTPARSRGRTTAGRASRSTSSSSTSCTSARSPRRARSTASIPRLAALRELGVTAIELMPVATFPGERGWGYDGLYTYAPHPAYGGPDGLARLVDAAHADGPRRDPRRRLQPRRPGQRGADARSRRTSREARDLLGRRDRLLAARRARVGDPERRAVGARLPRRRPAARRGARDLRRLAAAHLRRARRARARGEPARARHLRDGGRRLAADRGVGPRRAVGATRRTTSCTSLLTGEQDGYYAGYGSVAALADDLQGAGHDPRRLVVLRAEPRPGRQPRGRRPAAARRAARRRGRDALLAVHAAPLHGRGVLRAAARSSSSPTTSTRRSPRRRARGGGRSSRRSRRSRGEDVPDPQAVETFLRSKLEPREPDPLYRELLALRRELPRELEVVEADEDAKRLRLRRGDVELVADFAREAGRGSPLMDVWPGKPFPLGPTWDGNGTNFALFSENAERVELCLFDGDDRETRVELSERDGVQLALLPPRRRARASATATASTARTTRRPGTASTRRSC